MLTDEITRGNQSKVEIASYTGIHCVIHKSYPKLSLLSGLWVLITNKYAAHVTHYKLQTKSQANRNPKTACSTVKRNFFFFSYTVDSLKKITIIIIINKGSLIMQSTGNNLQALSLIKVGGLVLFGKEKQSTC